MESLLVRQGKNLWPQALPARTEIFRTLSKRLRQVIRTLNLTQRMLIRLSRLNVRCKASTQCSSALRSLLKTS